MLDKTLKKRFCKDENLSINIMDEPYFTERLELVGKTKTYHNYTKMIENRFNNDGQAYLEYYNKIKDSAIDYIKNLDCFKALNTCVMPEIKNFSITKSDIYRDCNVGHRFISLDIQHANFSVLTAFALQNNIPTWSDKFPYSYYDFISQFTDVDHIIDSKYIRQVIFGNCNPKRQITYATYLMSLLLSSLLETQTISTDSIASLRTDEIIIHADNCGDWTKRTIQDNLRLDILHQCPIKYEEFTLGKINGTKAYVKKIENTLDPQIKPKCVSPDEMPIVMRALRNEEITEHDLVILHEGKLAILLEKPETFVTYEPINGDANGQTED